MTGKEAEENIRNNLTFAVENGRIETELGKFKSLLKSEAAHNKKMKKYFPCSLKEFKRMSKVI